MITHDGGGLEAEVAGERVLLYAERGMLLPRFNTAVVADLHWGKAATFRALNIPVPTGTTAADLARLSRLLERTGADRLVVLGDLIHARAGRQADVLDALHAWRDAHAALEIVLVRGNHDAHAGDPPASLRIECVDGPWTLGPFTCEHEPEPQRGAYVLAGHLHPSVTLAGRARQRERLCCFAFGPDVGILPAFASFTGGGAYRRADEDRIFAIVEDEVMRVP
ncbi:MAG TPA: ligase-associated DNA damage response endonuclease PdeM [Gemmatimonas sp.]|nr:ligase-associated DNA damage response endonuclease PdeM [Gemmatimonas sp.]